MSKSAKKSNDLSPAWDKEKISTFQRVLADWFRREARVLPWRVKRSVYRTVVSEFMLQQTRVTTVLPYFEKWMQVFPDFSTLAKAEEDEVLRLWQGLGYYSRARNLHKLAKVWVNLDSEPVTSPEWQRLPGIGPYSAAAISSLSRKQPEAVVDGNVVRVLSRLWDDRKLYRSAAEAVEAYRPLSAELLNVNNPGTHNEGLMELGAMVCLARSPLCTVCPVYRFCASGQNGRAQTLPRITRSTKVHRTVHHAWVFNAGKILLRRHLPGERMTGLVELPEIDSLQGDGWKCGDKPILVKKRGIGNEKITEKIFVVSAPGKENKTKSPFVWVRLEELDNYSISGPHRRWIQALLAQIQPSGSSCS